MTISRIVCAAVFLGTVFAQQTAAPALLQVTVTDPYGRFVTGLRQESFHVFEDGVEQPIASFTDKDGNAAVELRAVGKFQVELKNQYLIGYSPSSQARAAGSHRIVIRVESIGLPPLQVRSLTVYYPR
jgi:hypothetical protein